MNATYYDKDRRELVLNYDYEGRTVQERYFITEVLHIAEPRESLTGAGYVMMIELSNRNKCPMPGLQRRKFHTFPMSKDTCYTMFFRMSDDHHKCMMHLRRN